MKPLRVYVASSWRNRTQQDVVHRLREAGHEVYDFMNPPMGVKGLYSWELIDPNWKEWTPDDYLKALMHPRVQLAFDSDHSHMEWADVCVMVMPCGRSAHLEAGYFHGAKKVLIILLSGTGPFVEPELMYKMADYLSTSIDDVIQYLDDLNKPLKEMHV